MADAPAKPEPPPRGPPHSFSTPIWGCLSKPYGSPKRCARPRAARPLHRACPARRRRRIHPARACKKSGCMVCCCSSLAYGEEVSKFPSGRRGRAASAPRSRLSPAASPCPPSAVVVVALPSAQLLPGRLQERALLPLHALHLLLGPLRPDLRVRRCSAAAPCAACRGDRDRRAGRTLRRRRRPADLRETEPAAAFVETARAPALASPARPAALPVRTLSRRHNSRRAAAARGDRAAGGLAADSRGPCSAAAIAACSDDVAAGGLCAVRRGLMCGG